MSRTQITAVLDPADSLDTHRHIAGLADAARSTVVVEIHPHARRIQSIAEDVLNALDKDLTRSGSERNGRESWAQAVAWLIGERSERMIVTRCHTMPTRYIETFTELAALTGIHLTLLYGAATHSRGVRETLRRLAIPVVSLADSQIKPRKRATPRPGTSDLGGVAALDTALPDDDFPTFHAAARLALRGPARRRFDTIYQASQRAASTVWTAATPRDVEAVAAAMLKVVLPANSRAELLIKIRAVQVSALHHGYLIGWREGGPALTDRPDPRDPAALATLRRYAAPRYATIGLLPLLAPTASLASLADVRIHDVAPDGRSITIAGDTIAVPATAAGILRAQRVHRLMTGATRQQGLIQADTRAMSDNGRGLTSSTATIHRLLRTLEAETGLPVIARWSRRQQEPAYTWAKRAGFTIKPLPEPSWHRS